MNTSINSPIPIYPPDRNSPLLVNPHYSPYIRYDATASTASTTLESNNKYDITQKNKQRCFVYICVGVIILIVVAIIIAHGISIYNKLPIE